MVVLHDCFAVLVSDDDYDSALIELSEWIKRIEDNGYTIEVYDTGATGVQAMISGTQGKCIKLN